MSELISVMTKKITHKDIFIQPITQARNLCLFFPLGSQSNKSPSLSKYILNLSAFFNSHVTTLIKNFITSHLILIDLSLAFGLSVHLHTAVKMFFLKFKFDHVIPFLINFNTFCFSRNKVDSVYTT